MKLSSLYGKYRHLTDKGTVHSYIAVYDNVLSNRPTASSLLEIGVQSGGSLLMWSELLHDGIVCGVDVDDCNVTGRFEFYKADATKKEFVDALGDRRFDIIIDDGSHYPDDIMASIRLLFPRLNSGGVYIIEDIVNESRFTHYNRNELESYGDVKIYNLTHINGRYDNTIITVDKK